jgi:hypothetical protein
MIYESRLLQMQGADHEAVVSPPQMGHSEASAVRSARK